jgi:hypothetical protein
VLARKITSAQFRKLLLHNSGGGINWGRGGGTDVEQEVRKCSHDCNGEKEDTN